MFRFRIATLLAAPLVVGSIHVAVFYPVATAVAYLLIGIALIVYALTSTQRSTYLDVEPRLRAGADGTSPGI